MSSSPLAPALPSVTRALIVRLTRPDMLLLAPIVVGLLLRLRKAWADIPTLVAEATPDDAYYYFQIARNIATGHNVTFDGETLTNGFHPLWMALLTPLFLLTDDAELAVHLGLTMGALLGVGTVFLVYAIVKTLTDNPWAALAGATFYAIHPYLVVESVNGMETALTVFMVALTIWLFVRIVCRSDPAPLVSCAWLGVSAGLMVLARTDTVFIAAPVLLFLVARERDRSRWRGPLATGGLILLVIAPWAIWSLVTFGTIIQVSGVASGQFQRDAYLAEHGSSLATQIGHSWDMTRDAFFTRLPELYFVSPGGRRVVFLSALAAAFAVMLLAPLSPQRRLVTRQIGLLLLPAVGVLAALFFHSAIRWQVREWYFGPAALVGAVFLGVVVSYLHSVLQGTHLAWTADKRGEGPAASALPTTALTLGRWQGPATAALYGIVVLALVGVYGPQRSEIWVRELPHRLNMLETARWIAGNTDPQGKVGASNAGIIGYFSERTVVNLDGVVNEDAYEARREGRMPEYVLSKEIRYFADLQGALILTGCGESPPLRCTRLITIGTRVPYFDGGLLDVLEVVAEPS